MQIFYRLTRYLNINIVDRLNSRITSTSIATVFVLFVVIGASAFAMRPTAPVGWLTSYHLASEPIAIDGLDGDASGLTYSPNSNTLFLVVANPTKILELSLDGKVLRTITLTGFQDTEGIAYIEGQKFAILEERLSAVNFVTITPDTHDINKSVNSSFVLDIFIHSEKNRRLEGISIDHATGDIYLVKEKSPRALYKISGLLGNSQNINISIPWDIEDTDADMNDLSGLVFEPKLRRLLMLSDESSSLSEFSLDGEYLSSMKLEHSRHGLLDDIPQAEGVTLTTDGSLYIVSEPNLLYHFVKNRENVAN